MQPRCTSQLRSLQWCCSKAAGACLQGRLAMHDQLRELGRAIEHSDGQGVSKSLEERRRIWRGADSITQLQVRSSPPSHCSI